MPSLQTLPTELIVAILSTGDIYTAVHLSSVDRRMHAIWLEHVSAIVETVLAPQIRAYEDALDFTMTECRCTQKKNTVKATDWLPRLLQNNDMAFDICNEFEKENDDEVKTMNISKDMLWASYYLIRRLVLAYHHRELLPGIASRLEADSKEALDNHERLYDYILNDLSCEIREKHRIVKPEDQWRGDDHLVEHPMPAEWDEFGPIEMIACAARSRETGEPFPCQCPKHVYPPPAEEEDSSRGMSGARAQSELLSSMSMALSSYHMRPRT